MLQIQMSLEFHDSKIKHIIEENNLVKVVLEPAVIHKSSSKPGQELGEVWLYKVELHLKCRTPANFKQYSSMSILDGLLEMPHQASSLISVEDSQEYQDGTSFR